MEFVEFSWRAPEFEYREKGVGWYWLTILIAVAVLALALWQKNFLFGVFVILAEVMIIVWGSREPRLVEFMLGKEGLTIDRKKVYPYREIESYAVDHTGTGEWTSLIFRFKRQLRSKLRVTLPIKRTDEIRSVIATIAPEISEVEWEHSLVDTLEKFFGF